MTEWKKNLLLDGRATWLGKTVTELYEEMFMGKSLIIIHIFNRHRPDIAVSREPSTHHLDG